MYTYIVFLKARQKIIEIIWFHIVGQIAETWSKSPTLHSVTSK